MSKPPTHHRQPIKQKEHSHNYFIHTYSVATPDIDRADAERICLPLANRKHRGRVYTRTYHTNPRNRAFRPYRIIHSIPITVYSNEPLTSSPSPFPSIHNTKSFLRLPKNPSRNIPKYKQSTPHRQQTRLTKNHTLPRPKQVPSLRPNRVVAGQPYHVARIKSPARSPRADVDLLCSLHRWRRTRRHARYAALLWFALDSFWEGGGWI